MVLDNPLKRVWTLINLDKEEIGSIYFYAIMSGLLQLTIPIGVQAIIGFVLGASMVTSIYVLIILVVVGVLLIGLLQINQMKIIEKVLQNIFTRFSFEFSEKLPRFDLLKSDNYYLPEKVNRFFDILTVQKSLAKLLLDIPMASIQILFGLILLSLYHPIFIFFGIMLIILLYLIIKLSSKNGLQTSYDESNYKYQVVAWLQEMARVILTLKYSQGTHLNLIKTDKYVAGYLKSRTAHFNVLLFQYRTLVFFKVVVTAAMLGIGSYLLLNQKLNIGEFIAAEIVILSLISAVEKLIARLENVYDIIISLEKIASITESDLEIDGNIELADENTGVSIEMRELSFSYPDGKKVLKDLNIQIVPNSVVCISNKEGFGKTTLLKILSANFKEYSGAILINNISINNYQLESLRKHTGILIHQQDVFMGSILENISMGKPGITIEKITKLARTLGIQNSFNELIDGFNTEIEPAGMKLTSTLIKNILILRAFIHQPNLLLLEEPWLGYDETIKQNIIQYLLTISTNATVIVASDDEAFAKKCDYQIILSNGNAEILKNK